MKRAVLYIHGKGSSASNEWNDSKGWDIFRECMENESYPAKNRD